MTSRRSTGAVAAARREHRLRRRADRPRGRPAPSRPARRSPCSARTDRARPPSPAACSGWPPCSTARSSVLGAPGRPAARARPGRLRAAAAHRQRRSPRHRPRGRSASAGWPGCGLFRRLRAADRARRRRRRRRRRPGRPARRPGRVAVRWPAAPRAGRPRARRRARAADHGRAHRRRRRRQPGRARRRPRPAVGRGTTLLVVTHEAGPLAGVLARAVVVDHGRSATTARWPARGRRRRRHTTTTSPQPRRATASTSPGSPPTPTARGGALTWRSSSTRSCSARCSPRSWSAWSPPPSACSSCSAGCRCSATASATSRSPASPSGVLTVDRAGGAPRSSPRSLGAVLIELVRARGRHQRRRRARRPVLRRHRRRRGAAQPGPARAGRPTSTPTCSAPSPPPAPPTSSCSPSSPSSCSASCGLLGQRLYAVSDDEEYARPSGLPVLGAQHRARRPGRLHRRAVDARGRPAADQRADDRARAPSPSCSPAASGRRCPVACAHRPGRQRRRHDRVVLRRHAVGRHDRAAGDRRCSCWSPPTLALRDGRPRAAGTAGAPTCTPRTRTSTAPAAGTRRCRTATTSTTTTTATCTPRTAPPSACTTTSTVADTARTCTAAAAAGRPP